MTFTRHDSHKIRNVRIMVMWFTDYNDTSRQRPLRGDQPVIQATHPTEPLDMTTASCIVFDRPALTLAKIACTVVRKYSKPLPPPLPAAAAPPLLLT